MISVRSQYDLSTPFVRRLYAVCTPFVRRLYAICTPFVRRLYSNLRTSSDENSSMSTARVITDSRISCLVQQTSDNRPGARRARTIWTAKSHLYPDKRLQSKSQR